MKTFPLLIALLLPITLLGQGGLPDQAYIYVEGKAQVEKPADMAILHFEVVVRAPDEKKANADVQAKANRVFELTKSSGIAKDDVIAESLRSEPQFENEGDYRGNGKIIGYAVSRRFDIKVRNVQAFPKLADDLISIGGIEFSSIEGGLQKQDQLREEMWKKAITNAREQAERRYKAKG